MWTGTWEWRLGHSAWYVDFAAEHTHWLHMCIEVAEFKRLWKGKNKMIGYDII